MPPAFAGIPIAPVNAKPLNIKALIYGRPGAGKTTLAGSAIDCQAMMPMLYMTPDQAEADTLRQVAPSASHMIVTKFQQFFDVRDELAKQSYNTPDGPFFKTVVVDTGTEAEKLSMREIMDYLVKNGRPGGGDVDADVPSVREWGKSISQMRRMIRGFRDLPINFIMCCHETEKRDNKGVDWRRPDLPGKLSNQVAGMFSTVLYIYIKTEKEGKTSRERRLVLTGLTEGYVAKSRVGALPQIMEEPTMSQLHKLITA